MGVVCDIISLFENRWCGSMAEQLICNQQVVGSTPITSSSDIRRPRRRSILESISYGSVPEWPKGTDCKSAGNAFGGPNPPAPTTKKHPPLWRVLFCAARGVAKERRVVGRRSLRVLPAKPQVWWTNSRDL